MSALQGIKISQSKPCSRLQACAGKSAFGGAYGSWWQDPLAVAVRAGHFGLQKLSPWGLSGVKLLGSRFRLSPGVHLEPSNIPPKKSSPSAQVLMEMVHAGQVACLLFKVLSCPAFWDSVASAWAVRNPGWRLVALTFPRARATCPPCPILLLGIPAPGSLQSAVHP